MDLEKGDKKADISDEVLASSERDEEHAITELDEAGMISFDESNTVLEPYVGMEFESEDSARNFYYEYATQKGFVVRVMQRRCSEIDGRTLARRLGCNKQGFSPNSSKERDKKQKLSVREGCKATFLVKMDKSTKWVVTRFVKEHNHPLVAIAHRFSMEGDKDKKIRELTMALKRQTQLCASYREKLLKLLANVEEQAEYLSSKVRHVVENVRKVEAEVKVKVQKLAIDSLEVNFDISNSLDVNVASKFVGNGDASDVEEPCVGMEFDSEDSAKKFYDEYSRNVGFKMRIDQCRRSEVDKKIISRRFSCNKEGYYTKSRNQFGQIKKQHTSSRQGCNAMMLVRVNKFGKWVVTRFVKEHTHPLVFSASLSRTEMDSKEKRIQALTVELKHQDRLISFYREQLRIFLRDLEEQTELWSTKIQVAVDNVREIETKGLKL